MLRSLPNILTILRIILIIPFVIMIIDGRFKAGFYILLAAGFTDALDGYLARRYSWSSKIGGILDPVADKLLMISAYFVLSMSELLPWWISVLVICRDLMIVAGATTYYFWIEKISASPTLLSKLNTVLLVLLVLMALGNAIWPMLSIETINMMIWSVATLSILTGIQYVWIWTRKAWRIKHEHGA